MPEAPGFLPVHIIEAGADGRSDDPSRDASSPIQVLLPGGRRIAVGAEFDPETLRRVIAALEVPRC
jgi:hypothetical protein